MQGIMKPERKNGTNIHLIKNLKGSANLLPILPVPQNFLYMPNYGKSIRPATHGIFMQRRMIIGHGLPVQSMPPYLLGKYPDANPDVCSWVKNLFKGPAVLFDPVGVYLHDPDVKGTPGTKRQLRIAQGFIF